MIREFARRFIRNIVLLIAAVLAPLCFVLGVAWLLQQSDVVWWSVFAILVLCLVGIATIDQMPKRPKRQKGLVRR